MMFIALLSLSSNKFLCISIICFSTRLSFEQLGRLNVTPLVNVFCVATLSNIKRYKLSFSRNNGFGPTYTTAVP